MMYGLLPLRVFLTTDSHDTMADLKQRNKKDKEKRNQNEDKKGVQPCQIKFIPPGMQRSEDFDALMAEKEQGPLFPHF